jgi:lipid-A-disaccharide synthase
VQPFKIFISAGEASGDAHAGALAAALREAAPGVEIAALGGAQLQKAGARLIHDYHEVAVVGLFEVIKHYPVLRRVFNDLVSELEKNRPDLLLLVDFPDFNLRLAEKAAALKIPVVYYISPQVWAWRKGRVAQIRRLVKQMLVILPFETAIYEQAGVPVEYVGHPLADHYAHLPADPEFRARHGFNADSPIIGLLPGSRPGEVERLLPPLLAAAVMLHEEFPAAQFAVPSADWLAPELFAPLREFPWIRLVRDDYAGLLRNLHAAAVASGTATLECGYHQVPGCMIYRISPLTYLLAKQLVKVPHIALVNLVADLPGGGRVYPELIQGDCTPGKIAGALRPLLADPARHAEARARLAVIREKLGPPGASAKAAAAVRDVLQTMN